MKKSDRREIARILSDPDLPHNQLMQIPGVLYFPRKIVEDLEKIREYNEYSYGQLVAWALKLQLPRWKRFHKFVMKPCEPVVWPEDPMFALACVTLVHWVRTFHKMMEDPDAIDAALEQLKRDAPPDWSFGSIEEFDELDESDWWKGSEAL